MKYTFFLSFFLVAAGVSGQQKTDRELKIGDYIPDIVIENILNYEKEKFSFKDLKGEAVILDFWDTWCGSCITQFPKLNALEAKFEGKLKIIGVTKSQAKPIASFLDKYEEKYGIRLTSVASDTLLSKLFPHRFLPHYVWIDKNGQVRAITGADAITQDNLTKLVSSYELKTDEKKDSRFKQDRSKPLFGANQVLYDGALSYHSVITKYIQTIQYGESGFNPTGILCTNHPLLLLYKIAYGEFDLSYMSNDRIVLSGFDSKEDSLNLGFFTDKTVKEYEGRLKDISFNYELFIQDSSLTKAEMFEVMREDLNRYFIKSLGITARKERRTIPVLNLVRTTANDNLKTKGDSADVKVSPFSIKITNKKIWKLVQMLYISNPNLSLSPIVDKTGYTDNIDIEVANYSDDMEEVNKSLEEYGLKLAPSTMEIDMIIIEKNKK